MIEIITNPGQALVKAKQEKNLGYSLVVALLASLLTAISVVLLVLPLMQIATQTALPFGGKGLSAIVGLGAGIGLGIIAIIVFIMSIVAELLIGWLAGIVMRTLGGKGGFFEGFTVIAYSCFVSSIAFIALGILNFIPFIGLIIGGIIALLLFGISLAIVYRGLKEMFETDMITALVGVGVITGTAILTFYTVFLLFYVQLIAMLGSLGMETSDLTSGMLSFP